MFILFPVSAISIFFANILVELFALDDRQGIRTYLNSITGVLSIVSILIALFLNLYGTEILSLFGKGFDQGENLLLVLSVGYTLSAMFGSYETVLLISDYKERLSRINLQMIFLNLVLNFPLVYYYGINGAAAGTLIVIVYSRLLQIYLVNKYVLSKHELLVPWD